VHLVGFIVRIYHDARSPECQKNVRLLMAYFRRTVWLTDSRFAVSQFCAAVKRSTRSVGINQL